MSATERAICEDLRLGRVSVASSGLGSQEEVDAEYQCPICLVSRPQSSYAKTNSIPWHWHEKYVEVREFAEPVPGLSNGALLREAQTGRKEPDEGLTPLHTACRRRCTSPWDWSAATVSALTVRSHAWGRAVPWAQ